MFEGKFACPPICPQWVVDENRLQYLKMAQSSVQVVQLHSLESCQPDPPSTVNPCLQAGRQGTMEG